MTDTSFPASERIRSQNEFQKIYKEGTAFHGTFLVAFIYQKTNLERRVGIVAGRKVGNAVRRNRSKRLLREAYRQLRPLLPSQGLQLILVARRACADTSSRHVSAELHRLCESYFGEGLRPNPNETIFD
ncbi:MAG: ribonuclease P protein component [Candidatus Eisenbacteria bacterium]|uniref:Ribonuclease P protein component n=1 Tax=Eiseniibacteriota bacterium TaxID=2212470 RepID=A0A7Y2E7T4_UNCEI|nr:ribonuclease P protein component [Candidatus Eisenbacteria bacterium]